MFFKFDLPALIITNVILLEISQDKSPYYCLYVIYLWKSVSYKGLFTLKDYVAFIYHSCIYLLIFIYFIFILFLNLGSGGAKRGRHRYRGSIFVLKTNSYNLFS